MSPIASAVSASAAALYAAKKPAAPTCLWASTVTGTLLTAADAADPEYWSRHALCRVDFPAALRTVMEAYTQSERNTFEVSHRLSLVELGEGMLERFAADIVSVAGDRTYDVEQTSLLPRKVAGAAESAASWETTAREVEERRENVMKPVRAARLQRFLLGLPSSASCPSSAMSSPRSASSEGRSDSGERTGARADGGCNPA